MAVDNKEGRLKSDRYDYFLGSVIKDTLVVDEPATLSEIASQGAGRGVSFYVRLMHASQGPFGVAVA